jgi:hypothetical protein
MWHERAQIEKGEEKLLDFELLLAPHTEHADQAVSEIRTALQRMTNRDGR